MREGLPLRGTMRRASWKPGSLGDKGVVLVAPVNDDFVFGHSDSPNLYFMTSAHLLDLVQLSLTAVPLLVDFLLYPRPAKEMVAAFDPLLKTQTLQK
jgi:hypothetical protein